MVSKELVMIGASVLLGLFCIRHIRSFDKHEKEPFLKMLAVTVWGGVWSIALAMVMYGAVGRLGLGDLHNSFGALFVIGPVEEMAKLIAFLSAYPIYRKEMNEAVDGMIYMACVALGFSIIENYVYALKPNSEHLLFLRLFISTPMHICFSAFMGLAVYIWLKNKKATGLVLISFLAASISHGVYDLIIFNGFALIILIIVMRSLYGWTMDLLSYATAHSPFRPSLKEFLTAVDNPEMDEGIECLYCGNRDLRPTFSMKHIRVQHCGQCGHFVTTKKSLFNLFQHFAATFKNVKKEIRTRTINGRTYRSLYGCAMISDDRDLAFFNLDEVNLTLGKLNRAIVEKMEGRWWFPNNLLDLEREGRTLDYGEILTDGRLSAWKWLIHPFSSDKHKSLHPLPDKKPFWNWNAFIIPGFWFLYHELWGVFFVISGLYMAMIYTAASGHLMGYGRETLAFLLLLRLIAGKYGNDMYYTMHGKWPISSWNKRPAPAFQKEE